MTSLMLLAVLGGIGLRGNTTCPTIQQVDAQLGTLASPNDGELSWVELESRPGELHLSLWGPHGRLEAIRSLPVTANCEALARAAAITIATWALEPQRRVTVVEPALEPEPERVFSTKALRAAREAALIDTRPEPPRMRGPLALMASSTLLQVAAIVGSAVLSRGWSTEQSGVAIAAVFLGNTVSLLGLVWLMQCFSPDASPVF